jgi:hypothetical protein
MTDATTLGVPENWHSSIPHSSRAVSKYPFTCIGVDCWSGTPVDWDGKTVTHPAWKCSNSLREKFLAMVSGRACVRSERRDVSGITGEGQMK